MDEKPLALQPPDASIYIRPVKLTDAEALYRCCWSDRPLASVYRLIMRARRRARNGNGLGVVAEMGDPVQLVGYGQFTLWPRCGEISDLIVAKDYRGHGVGTAIIQYLMQAARDMHAPCVEIGAALSNPRAVALYRRLGFVDNHTLEMNLGTGEEVVLYLRLEITSD